MNTACWVFLACVNVVAIVPLRDGWIATRGRRSRTMAALLIANILWFVTFAGVFIFKATQANL